MLPVELLTGEGGDWGEGVGEEPNQSYDGDKAWSSINHSILSGLNPNPESFQFFCEFTNNVHHHVNDTDGTWTFGVVDIIINLPPVTTTH